jgi:hypothetical protein
MALRPRFAATVRAAFAEKQAQQGVEIPASNLGASEEVLSPLSFVSWF